MRISDLTYNRLKILRTIRSEGPIARTELKQRTGLSGATITEMTSDLLDRGLIVEAPEKASGRGRPRVKLAINAAGGLALAARLQPEVGLGVALVDLRGDARFSAEVPLGRAATLAELAQRVADALQSAIEASGTPATSISRVAIVLPAVLDSIRGEVHWMATFAPGPCPFAEIVAARLGVPVTIENGSSNMARAEHWSGRARDADTFSVFHVGFGISAAQFVDGLPRVGANGLNPEIAHVKTDLHEDALPCICGSRGCLMVYSSMYGLLLRSGRLSPQRLPSTAALLAGTEELLAEAENGSPEVLALFGDAGRRLGVAVADHINAVDPGLVLVLCEEPRFLALLAPAFHRAVESAAFSVLLDRTRVELAECQPDWHEKGAAALALEQVYVSM